MEDLDHVHVHRVVSVAFHEACDQDVAFQDDGWDDDEEVEDEDACVDGVPCDGEEEVDVEPASLDLDHGVDAWDGADGEVVHVHEDHGDEAWTQDEDDHSYAVTVDPSDDLDLVRYVAQDVLVDQEGYKHSVQGVNGVPESLDGEEDEVTDEEVDLETVEPTLVGAIAPNCVLVLLIPGCFQSGSFLEMYLTSWTTFLPFSSSAQLCNPPCCV